jgi:hypothetical protein
VPDCLLTVKSRSRLVHHDSIGVDPLIDLFERRLIDHGALAVPSDATQTARFRNVVGTDHGVQLGLCANSARQRPR